jgi:hypothetical protein
MLSRSILRIVLLAALPRLAAAQPGTDTDIDLPPRYNVEVVVFAHTDIDPGEEYFALEDELSSVGGDGSPALAPESAIAIAPFGSTLPQVQTGSDTAVRAGGAGPDTDAGSNSPPGMPAPGAGATDGTGAGDPLVYLDPFGTFGSRDPGAVDVSAIRLLTPEELQLGDARAILDRLGAYRLLGHGGWQQFGLDEGEAVPVDVARLGVLNPTGTIELYLGRFLHVRVDLDYREPSAGRVIGQTEPDAAFGAAVPPGSAAPRGSMGLSGLTAFELPQRYRLATERNAIRSGELHYIDHPRFGVLVLVTPAPQDDADPAEPGGEAQPSP